MDILNGEDGARLMMPEAALSGILWQCSQESMVGACLVPLLVALGYRGDWRHVADALPYREEPLDLTGLRSTLTRLSFSSHLERCDLTTMDARRLPCLFISPEGDVAVALGDPAGFVVIFNTTTGRLERPGFSSFSKGNDTLSPLADFSKRGVACFFEPIDIEERSFYQARVGWFSMVTERFRPLIGHVLLLTLIITVLQIIFPLFVMTVYDRVLGSGLVRPLGAVTTLIHLLIGVGIALLFDWLFRKIRASIAVDMGAQLDGIIGGSTFLRILSLPIPFIERSPISSQVARLKEFDTVRAFFTTPLVMVFFDLPFSVLILSVIALLGGFLVFVPLSAMLLFALLWFVIQPVVSREESRSRLAVNRKQEFAMESLSKMRAIRYCGAEGLWMERFRTFSSQSAQAHRRVEMINAAVQTTTHIVVVGAGMITIAGGVFQVLAAEMSGGALVAIMIFVWKALSPVQSIFLATTRLHHVRSSIGQINALMNVVPEREEESVPPLPKRLVSSTTGTLSFVNVGMRYAPESEPALAGVSFEMRAGEMVAIVGPNGSGKSTLLKIVLGLYVPQMGSIRIDGLDIRRVHPITLRQSMVYAPQSGTLYHGSIRQNLRLAHPLATDEMLERACQQARAYDAIIAMPQGFETWVGGRDSVPLPAGLIQKISLARAYLKVDVLFHRAKVGGFVLLDEPTNTLDRDADLAFMEQIQRLRGHCTLLMVTHRPSHMRLADRIFYLERGLLRLAGPTAEVLPKILKESA